MRYDRVQNYSLDREPLAVRIRRGTQMQNLLPWLGRLAGVVGLLLCAVAAIWRLLGNFYLGGIQVATLLQAGTSALVVGCFLLLLGGSARR